MRGRLGRRQHDGPVPSCTRGAPPPTLGLVSPKIVLNGKEYDGVESMPPDVRKDYEAVLESLKATGGDEVLSMLGSGERASTKATARPSRPVLQPQVAIEERGRRGWGGRILAAIFWMAVGAVLAVWVMRRGYLSHFTLPLIPHQ